MNCQKFETIVSELARNQMMEADLRVEALDHKANCPECAERLRKQEALSSTIASLANDMATLQAPPQLELKLREAFRQSRQVMPLPVKKQVNSRYWLTAIAAMLLIAVGVGVVSWQVERQQPQIAAIALPSISMPGITPMHGITPMLQQSDETKPSNVNGVTEHKQKSNSFYAKNTRRRPTRGPVDSNHPTREVATDFIALGSMNAANFQDGGQIVRVELPRSALAKFGIPVNMDRYNENVKADVLYGVDGLAHAIRFVQ